jgi:hypothetical protein
MGEGRKLSGRAVGTLVAILLLTGLVAAPVGALDGTSHLAASADQLTFEAQFLDLINEERVAEGLGALARLPVLVEGARGQAQAIEEAGYLFHNPNLAAVTTGWYALGENVGYGPTVEALHQAFMDSPGHRANVLKDTYNYGGVGVVIDSNNVIWVAIVFMYGPEGLAEDLSSTDESNPDPVEQYEGTFSDDEGSVHEDSIEAIAEAGITNGCRSNGLEYCPQLLVTRAQMATFIMRALDLPASKIDFFIDDDGTQHETAINALAEAGISLGCGNSEYCGDEPVTRAQMATFLQRALDLQPGDADGFVDDDGSTHEDAINALAANGISGGCDSDTRLFCPNEKVTRAQMASFLARALGLVT